MQDTGPSRTYGPQLVWEAGHLTPQIRNLIFELEHRLAKRTTNIRTSGTHAAPRVPRLHVIAF